MKQLLSGMLAMLTVLMMTGCMGDADPVRVSLDIDASDLVMNIGETSTRVGSSKAADSHFTYRTDNPSVATVDEDGEVTARSIGEATITVHMDENRTDWYAATDRTYRVVVKAPSAEILRRYDRDTPLTFVALEDGKITITFNNGITLDDDIVYTINAGYDKIIPKNTQGSYDIVVKKNDFVQLFSENDALSSGITAGARGSTRAVADGAKYINIKPAMKTEIYGNVMSMLEGEFFDDDCEIDADFALYGLFAGAEKLVNNPFRHIELPAYELRDGCYQAMFYGCKGLLRAPDLPAGAVTSFCYKEMFAGCSKLSYLKCLADDISADDCTKDWLAGAGSEATDGKTLATTFPFPENSNDGVPAGWTNEQLYPVKSVTLNKTSLEMIAGSAETGTATLTATVGPEYASDKTLFWLTSNEKVATVDDDGKVTAVGSGEAKITATAGGKTATCKVTVAAGGVALSKATVGMVICEHGKAYEATTGNLSCGGKKVAVVAYKGAAGTADTSTGASGYVGLAIALKDANDGNQCQWCTALDVTCVAQSKDVATVLGTTGNFGKGIDNTNTLAGGCGASHVHAAARAAKDYKYDASVAAGAHPTVTSQWFLPTIYQWNLIVKGMCGDHGNLNDNVTNDYYKLDKFNTKITAAGGTGVHAWDCWSSVEYVDRHAWLVNFVKGCADHGAKADNSYVRAVLAF